MNLDDLRYSNSVYIYRAVSKHAMTVEEITNELKLAPLTVNKIIKKLFSDNILDKYKNVKDKRCGRPNIYYAPGSYYYSALLLSDNGKLFVYYISPNGEITPQKKLTIDLFPGEETIIANEARGHIGRENPRSLGIFLVGDNLHKFGEVKFVTKYDVNGLLSDAFSDDEKAVFIEHDCGKILINHAKAKIVDIDRKALENILDIDDYYDFRGKTQRDLIIDGMQKLTVKLLEEKI